MQKEVFLLVEHLNVDSILALTEHHLVDHKLLVEDFANLVFYSQLRHFELPGKAD